VSPLPGAQYLSPSTNIIIRARSPLDASLLRGSSFLAVSGSASGMHTGRIAYSADHTALYFTPDRAFTPGERVSVHIDHSLTTPSAVPEDAVSFQFEIGSTISAAMLSHTPPAEYTPVDTGIAPDAVSTKAHDPTNVLFRRTTLPVDFPTPVVTAMSNPGTGSVFIGTFKTGRTGDHHEYVTYIASDQQYIMILNNKGEPVFWKGTSSMNTGFTLQQNGHLTYFDSAIGAYVEMDSSYRVVDTYRCGNGYQTDTHECRVLPNGHVLLLGYDPETIDMSKLVAGGNPGATVWGMVIQELDENKQVIFQWRSFDHIPITDATQEDFTAPVIDAVHANALELDTDGNILLSSRHLDEVTKINRTTGDIIWRWGGKKNQFQTINDSVCFSHQHTIRRSPTGTYLLFDNGNFKNVEFSRGVEYVLDQEKKTATLIWQYRHTPDIYSIAMGSIERLANGNTMIGWGTASPAFTLVHPDGSTALEAVLPDSIVSYRALNFDWPAPAGTADVGAHAVVPTNFSLQQNYPNPFNPVTTISYSVPKTSDVTLSVHDILGRTVAVLVADVKAAGTYSVQFDASMLPSGVYYYRMRAGEFVDTRKLMLVK
jgi:hypothetical protein